MNDPYKVLGVSPGATDDQIKQAYRDLARKYHPDNYADTPLADLASEKMKEINAAYDQVQEMRKAAQSGQPYGGQGPFGANPFQGSYGGGYQQNSQYADVRRMISFGRITDAEELLDGIPFASRDAEWFFLKGNVLYTRGFLEDSMEYFQQAVNRDPQNPEYRAAYNQLLQQRQYGYARGGYQRGASMGCTPCDLCTALVCADCMCNSCSCC